MANAKLATHAGREGMWLLEGWCGQCGSGETVGPAVAERSERLRQDAVEEKSICGELYMGMPDNRCAWPLTYYWLFVPPGRGGSAA
jgi:hypothetical protein